jgi:hypothetical protein
LGDIAEEGMKETGKMFGIKRKSAYWRTPGPWISQNKKRKALPKEGLSFLLERA